MATDVGQMREPSFSFSSVNPAVVTPLANSPIYSSSTVQMVMRFPSGRYS